MLQPCVRAHCFGKLLAANRNQAETVSAAFAHLIAAVLVFLRSVAIYPQRYPQSDARYADLQVHKMIRRGGTTCTCCLHREKAALDLALSRGVAVRALARRYKLGIDALYRHSKNHLPPQLRAKLIAGPSVEGVDLESLRETESQSLLMNLIALRNRLLSGLDIAEECGDSGMVARVANQLHRNLEITGTLLGDLSTGGTTINNVLVMPAYVEMRVALVKALSPYPEARQAVAKVLHLIESKAADAIKANTERGLAHGPTN